MQLLLVTLDFPPAVGGIQTYAHELAARLAARGVALTVVAPSAPGSAAVDAGLAFEVIRRPAPGDGLALTALPWILGAARAGKVDAVLHAQWQTGPASMVVRRAVPGLPYFVAAHGRELRFDPLSRLPLVGSARSALRRRVLRGATGLFPVSGYTAGLLAADGVDPARVTVVHNGTDPDRFQPLDPGGPRRDLGLHDSVPVLLTVGRLVRRKGCDLVLRALAELAVALPDVVYLIAGDGPERLPLAHLARDLGLANRVRFLGRVDDQRLPRLYAACDLFVTAARHQPPDVEGFGIVFLEAGACARPVVGTRAGGVEDAIADGVTGRLVAPEDPMALAHALREILSNRPLAAAMGRSGRERVVASATWDHAAARILAVIERTLARAVPSLASRA